MAGALLTGGLFARDSHRPSTGHTVPPDFAGVGVATSSDPAVDDYIIGQLRELGTRQVRLDFSYGDAGSHAGRFLDALCAAGLRVMLHLVQPPGGAQRMGSEDARAEWREFVAGTLDRWGPHVEMVEVGSTVNRKRWTGYTLEGFLAAWDIAHHEVRTRDLVLAGPNVTDFEPLWNAGLLALLAARGTLPDVHTDNLFSERCTEPERWDHKIVGERLAPLVRFNLIKKAQVLARIGARAGVPRLMSPAAFWTLPRIARTLPDAEQKQADYLTRYMILCAASGVLERAYWGPLICHREGLVDEGEHPYPVLERIAHYAAVNGAPVQFRRRPAFEALAAFQRMIPGNVYEGRLNVARGLEVHAFTGPARRTHAVWTINGAVAALADLYDPQTLAAAVCLDRDGRALPERPTVATEMPIYLSWPNRAGLLNGQERPAVDREAPRIRPDAAPLPALSIHVHGGAQHYYFRDETWHGMVRAASPAHAQALIAALHPERIGAAAPGSTLRHARNAVWTVADPRYPPERHARLVVKQPVAHRLHKKLLDRLKPSKARRSWNGASELLRRGIGTAAPVAWFEQRCGKDLTKNWYVCEYIDDGVSVRELFSAYAAGHAAHRGIDQDSAYTQLCAFLLKLHGRGVFFRDLSGGNILVRTTERELDFALIDTARAHFLRDSLPLRKRLADLSRACHKLHAEGRERFMTLYLSQLKHQYGPLARLSLTAYDIKTGLKRRLRKTRAYRLLKG